MFATTRPEASPQNRNLFEKPVENHHIHPMLSALTNALPKPGLSEHEQTKNRTALHAVTSQILDQTETPKMPSLQSAKQCLQALKRLSSQQGRARHRAARQNAQRSLEIDHSLQSDWLERRNSNLQKVLLIGDHSRCALLQELRWRASSDPWTGEALGRWRRDAWWDTVQSVRMVAEQLLAERPAGEGGGGAGAGAGDPEDVCESVYGRALSGLQTIVLDNSVGEDELESSLAKLRNLILELQMDPGFKLRLQEIQSSYCDYWLSAHPRTLTPSYTPSLSDARHITLRPPIPSSFIIPPLPAPARHPISKLEVRFLGRSLLPSKRWLHFFDDIAAIVFATDVGAYDQPSNGQQDDQLDPIENALALSILGFEQIRNSRWFSSCVFVVVCTNTHVLARKLATGEIPFRRCFPDFECVQGRGETVQDVQRYICGRFWGILEEGKGSWAEESRVVFCGDGVGEMLPEQVIGEALLSKAMWRHPC